MVTGTSSTAGRGARNVTKKSKGTDWLKGEKKTQKKIKDRVDKKIKKIH